MSSSGENAKKPSSRSNHFWDNLIPLRPSLSGLQTAGWEPGPAAMSGLGCEVFADERIPVDGGITLSADVYRPKKPGRYPAIVQFAAYSKELHTAGVPTGTNEIGSPPIFTDRGYAQVVVSRRGMSRSEGEPGIFFNPQDVDDHARAIAWAAEQPWCDGNVVLFGTSYYGMTQPLVAVKNPPALKAFFCNEICTDYFRHLAQFGGAPGLYFLLLWAGANFTKPIFGLRVPPLVRALLSQILNSPLKSYWERVMMKGTDALYSRFMRNTPVKPVREWLLSWFVDGKTRGSAGIAEGPYAELAKIDVPFVVVQNLGYFNLHQFGAYDLFQHAGTLTDRKWMILGPPHYELPVYAWQLEALAFFDHILRGAQNGYSAQPRVRYWLDGADRFAGAENFPVPEGAPARFYLASGGEDAALHRLSELPGDGSNDWAAIPINAPMFGRLDQVANQRLTFEMPFVEKTEFSGPVTAHLRFSCNEIDSHIVARLGRVDTTAGYHLLSMGTISPARRKIDAGRGSACEIAIDTTSPEPLMPGDPVNLIFSLTPAPVQLQPGERLRLEIASRTDLLKSDVGHGFVHFNMLVPPYFSRNRLHYGTDSFIELRKVISRPTK
ncbi:MAG: CocE/NonD family hydrolase [Methylovirgula sp.]